METTNVMKKQKRTYLKPTLKVAEWDFNEAVCQAPYTNSGTRCITVAGAGTRDLVDTRPDYNGGSTGWRPTSPR